MCTYGLLTQLRLSENVIDPTKKITIKAYDEEEINSKGLVSLPIRVGPMERDVIFQVLDLHLSYNILLGRPWIHEMKVVPSTYHQCLKFPYNGVTVSIPTDTSYTCNALTQGVDAFVPNNRAASVAKILESLLKDLEKKLRITNTRMDGYKIEPILSLTSRPPSPRQSGKPSKGMRPQTSTPKVIYDGTFIQSSTSLASEIEGDDVLKSFFKEDSADKEIRHCEISPTQYGLGYKMLQHMGYSGTGPLGKYQKGIVEPIQLQTKSTNDKAGLGYDPRKSSDQKHTSHHQCKWKKKVLPLTTQEIDTQQTQEDCDGEQKELPTQGEEIDGNQVPVISAMIPHEVDAPEDMRDEIYRIKELFALLNILVTYIGRQQVDDSETDSNEYEWGLDHISDTSTTESLEELRDTADDAQELICLRMQKELEEIILK